MKKFLKVIGIILLILCVLVLIHTIRNFYIISTLQAKIGEYATSTNFHLENITEQDGERKTVVNYYTKEGKQLSITERYIDGKLSIMKMYNDGEKVNTFFEGEGGKSANLNNNSSMFVQIYNSLETESFLEKLIYSVLSIISSEEIEGRKCYIVAAPDNKLYIEKETGLLIKIVSNDATISRKYEFDNVEDSIFVEPDISEYTVQENN